MGLNEAARYPITINPGATFETTLAYGNDQQEPFDITGFQVKMDIKAKVADKTPLLSLSTDAGAGIVVDGPVGAIKIRVTPEQTAGLKEQRAVYDLFLIEPNGTVRKLLYGEVNITSRVTKWQQ